MTKDNSLVMSLLEKVKRWKKYGKNSFYFKLFVKAVSIFFSLNMCCIFNILRQLILLTLFVTVILEETKLNYSFRNIKIACSNFNSTEIRLGKCEIVAKRGTPGLVNLVVYYEGVSDFITTLRFLYRGTSGKYQPFLTEITLDACIKIKPTNLLLLRAAEY